MKVRVIYLSLLLISPILLVFATNSGIKNSSLT